MAIALQTRLDEKEYKSREIAESFRDFKREVTHGEINQSTLRSLFDLASYGVVLFRAEPETNPRLWQEYPWGDGLRGSPYIMQGLHALPHPQWDAKNTRFELSILPVCSVCYSSMLTAQQGHNARV